MSYTSKQVKYESIDFWVLETKDKTYEVYSKGTTHSTRVAIIGYKGDIGLKRAITELNKRQDAFSQKV